MGFFGFLKKGDGLQAPSKPPVPKSSVPDDLFDTLQIPVPPEHDEPLAEPQSFTDPFASFPPLPQQEHDLLPPVPAQQGPIDMSFSRDVSSSRPKLQEHDLPDFSDDEIEAAEQLAKEKLKSVQDLIAKRLQKEAPKPEEIEPPELPTDALPVLEDAENLFPREHEGPIYVSAVRYRDALAEMRKMREAQRRSDAHLKGLMAGHTAQKEPYSQFAEKLNNIQERLIQMDNQLMR
jgi:hypothetical protein